MAGTRWSAWVECLMVPGWLVRSVRGVAVPQRQLPLEATLRVGAGLRSVEGGDASVGGEDVRSGGPTVEDADDVASGFTNNAGGCVPERPAEPFR